LNFVIKKVPRNTLNRIATAALIVFFFAWQAAHLGGFERDYDEGAHFMEARMVQQGYKLYSEVFSAHPPLFAFSIAGAFELFGPSVAVGRTLILIYAILALVGVALAAEELGGNAGSPAAVFLLALTPNFFHWSRGALADLPSACLATLSIALALRHWRRRSRFWLAIVGLVTATSFLTKAIAATTVLPVTLLVLLRPGTANRPWRERIEDVFFMLTCVGLPILLCLFLFDPRTMIDQTIVFHLRGSEIYQWDLAENATAAASYFAENAGLMILAIGGSIVLLAQAQLRKQTAILILWFLVMGLSLLTHSPLFPKHQFIILLPPLAVLGGALVGDIVERCRRLKEQMGSGQGSFLVIELCSLALYGLHFPRIIEMDIQLIHGPKLEEPEQRVIHFLETSVTEDDFVISDDQYLAFVADRLVPPSLADTSWKRLHTGYLTVPELVEATIEYEAQAVLLRSDGRFVSAAPEYVNWLRETYRLAAWYGERREIYVPVDFIKTLQHRLRASLGHGVMLLGYDLNAQELVPGDSLRLVLYWEATGDIGEDYHVFTHLADKQDHIWGQKDGQPVKGLYPTSHWQPERVIRDVYDIAVPEDTPAGQYVLFVGMYALDSGERLPAFGENTERLPADRIPLGQTITIR
jgi:hypothetical protein